MLPLALLVSVLLGMACRFKSTRMLIHISVCKKPKWTCPKRNDCHSTCVDLKSAAVNRQISPYNWQFCCHHEWPFLSKCCCVRHRSECRNMKIDWYFLCREVIRKMNTRVVRMNIHIAQPLLVLRTIKLCFPDRHANHWLPFHGILIVSL